MKSRTRQFPGSSEPVPGTVPILITPTSTPSTSPPTMETLAHSSRPGTPSLSKAMEQFTHETAVRIKSFYRTSGWDPIATSAQLKELCVDLDALPLPLDRNSACMQPVQMERLKVWLNEIRPWEDRGRGFGIAKYMETPAWWDAYALACDLASYATASYADDVLGIEHKTNC